MAADEPIEARQGPILIVFGHFGADEVKRSLRGGEIIERGEELRLGVDH